LFQGSLDVSTLLNGLSFYFFPEVEKIGHHKGRDEQFRGRGDQDITNH
jgi:hypothetical protein